MSDGDEPVREEDDYQLVDPNARAMSQVLRAFGYDLPSAVADIVDNSVSAGARNIWLDFYWEGESSRLSITDDGQGMSEDELVEAMRAGSRSPLLPRNARDLGRFGLGMKSASFSQCRRLTVASRRAGGMTSVRCWDLNLIDRTNEWRLLAGGCPQAQLSLERLPDGAAGTAVVWEDMDRLVEGTRPDNRRDESRFLEHISVVKQHLATVFHRFLERPDPVHIWINNRPVSPWDPFLRNEQATQCLTEEPLYLNGGRMDVRPFVLPHHTRISHEVHELAAGARGWNAAQGFYVYRNDRLLVAGHWLGLGFQKEEHFKLARIMLDFPNSLDALWDIDVKKSRATPPPPLRDELRRIARLTRGRAAEVYRHKGKVFTRGSRDSEPVFVWGRKVVGGKTSYHINRQHPVVRDVLSGEPTRSAISALLRLLEETVPVPLVVIDHAEQPDQHASPFESAPSAEIVSVLRELFQALVRSGRSADEARAELGRTEPFDDYPELIATLEELPDAGA